MRRDDMLEGVKRVEKELIACRNPIRESVIEGSA
jgi:hypothetical protein